MSLTLEQKEARTKGIGGSDAAAVVGLSPYKSQYQLYLEKRGEAPLSDEETFQQKVGNLLEDDVADLYCAETGRQVRRHPTRFDAERPHMLVNVDRIILNDPRGPGYLECKALGDWSGSGIRDLETLPDHFYLQGQHGLCVTKWAFVSFAILIGNSRFVWFDVEPNDSVIAELIRQEGEFWERVQAGNPPPIDGSARTGELLKKLYPQDTGKVLMITASELREAASKLVSAKALVKQTEAEITLYENTLKNAIGDASEATIQGFGSITWKRAKDSIKQDFDIEKLKSKYPDAYADCQITKQVPGSRRFLLKPNKE